MIRTLGRQGRVLVSAHWAQTGAPVVISTLGAHVEMRRLGAGMRTCCYEEAGAGRGAHVVMSTMWAGMRAAAVMRTLGAGRAASSVMKGLGEGKGAPAVMTTLGQPGGVLFCWQSSQQQGAVRSLCIVV